MYKILRNSISILLLFSLCSTMALAATPAAVAEDNVEVTYIDEAGVDHVIDLNQCERIMIDAKGNILPQPKQALSQHTIASSSTMCYYLSGTTGWTITRGTKMTLSATLSKSGQSWACGYESDEYAKQMNSGKGSKIRGTASCPADGEYWFYIENNSSDPITIKSGSIIY